MKNEYTLALELCKINHNNDKIERLLKESVDYPFLLGWLLLNRMGAAAYGKLQDSGLLGKVNRDFKNILNRNYEIDCKKHKSFNEALEKIRVLLADANFPYAFLKGAYLSNVYPKGFRASNDIDILINQENIEDLSKILKQGGFVQGFVRGGEFCAASRTQIINSRMNRGETIPFIKQIDLPEMKFCEIDINFSCGYMPGEDAEIVNIMLQNSQKSSNEIKTLMPPDFLIHLFLHLHKEATAMPWVEMGKDLSLYKFCDIYLLIKKWFNANFVKEIATRIKDYKIEKESYYALRLTKEIFDIDNEFLYDLLENIKPKCTKYLKQIIDPATNKVYHHDKDIISWLFCQNRKDYLNEITHETTQSAGNANNVLRLGRSWKIY